MPSSILLFSLSPRGLPSCRNQPNQTLFPISGLDLEWLPSCPHPLPPFSLPFAGRPSHCHLQLDSCIHVHSGLRDCFPVMGGQKVKPMSSLFFYYYMRLVSYDYPPGDCENEPLIRQAQISVLLCKILLGFLELCLDEIFSNPINFNRWNVCLLHAFSILKPLSSGLNVP